ncbi:MAG TPA: DUF2946 family protein [Burkholderiales bacterium]|nr:DUF2946 family protein [Burkholderiales bacterium]
MDELVARGMAKWPNVPAVYGWLELDRRGNWLIKGSRIGNRALVDFIARNYERDTHGRWYFQNGPQRVFVRLHYTPIVYRAVSADGEPLVLQTHTGKRVFDLRDVWLDEHGTLLFTSEHGSGALHDADSQLVISAFRDSSAVPLAEEDLEESVHRVQTGDERALWIAYGNRLVKIKFLPSVRVPDHFGFCPCPEEPHHPEASS